MARNLFGLNETELNKVLAEITNDEIASTIDSYAKQKEVCRNVQMRLSYDAMMDKLSNAWKDEA